MRPFCCLQSSPSRLSWSSLNCRLAHAEQSHARPVVVRQRVRPLSYVQPHSPVPLYRHPHRDPLNAYAHLGMPKPFVHLFGPPLDVALDARITGDKSRFVRNGCRPNAVLRPIFCQSKQAAKSEDEDAIKFGIFALRDLKANEEVVLGWEWDDDNVVHHLPALIHSPFEFPYVILAHVLPRPSCSTSFPQVGRIRSITSARR